MRHIIFSLTLILFINFSVTAQKEKNTTITDIGLNYDTYDLNALKSNFRIGLFIKLKNERILKTVGLNKGKVSWNKFNVKANKATYSNGSLYYYPEQFINNGENIIKVTVSTKAAPIIEKTFEIEIPVLESFTLHYDTNAYCTPGFEIPLFVKAKYTNNEEYTTVYATGNPRQIYWQDFRINYFGKDQDKNIVYIPKSVDTLYKNLEVVATYLKQPEKKAILSMPITYKGLYLFKFNGTNGSSGRNGDDAYGYKGQNGIKGYNGENGEKGENGHSVKVYITSESHQQDTIVKIKAISKLDEKSVIFNANGGKLIVQSFGGRGGIGGKGGRGADGLDETSRLPQGRGSDGGDGGKGGNGGDGGKITVFIDNQTLPYLDKILEIQNKGGEGGDGGERGKKGKGGWVRVRNHIIIDYLLVQPFRGGKGKKGKRGEKGNRGKEGGKIKVKELIPEKSKVVFAEFVEAKNIK